jgi:hypothetical protein
MKIVKIPLSDLHPAERNVRIHSEKQIREFIRSLDKFDQIRPIVVDENNTILCGNGLYAALVAKGETEAECIVKKNLSENDKKKLMLADNKIYSLGVDDLSVFEDFLSELGDDLDIPGYDLDLLETLTADMDDVDEMLSGYGVISSETKEQISETSKKYEEDGNAYAETAEEIKASPPPAKTDEPEKVELQRRFITCPKCGERIWL